ncbi:MAG: hypothetical protein U0169_03445 [Polyangiaceae bacterium]
MRTTSAAEEAKEASERATRVLADATMAHDVAIGFTSGGPILTALASEATRTITPVIGKATFEATSNAAGDVLTLDVVSASTGLEEWRNAARAALLALAGKRIRASGRGRVVRMEIQSKWQLPSGRDPGVDIELLGRTVKKGGTGKTSAALKILDPIPKLATLTLPDGTKLNVPQITFTIIGTDIDPADIDATPRRVVNGRVIDEHGL